MSASEAVSENRISRADHLVERRAQNMVLAIFVGAPLGGVLIGFFVAAYIVLSITSLDVEKLRQIVILIGSACIYGLILGFPPAIIAALATNWVRGCALSRVERLALAPLAGAASVVVSYGLLLFVLIGGWTFIWTVIIATAGALSAFICGFVMEYRGHSVPFE